jgi:hypothetical protein
MPYLQEPIEREIDHTFHLYQQDIMQNSHDSILVAWNFGLNPWQFYPTAPTNLTVANGYIADQTIINSQTPSSLVTAKMGRTLTIYPQTGVAQGRFAIIQYVDATSAEPWWGHTLSSMFTALVQTTHGTNLNVKAKLIYRSVIPTDTQPITSWPINDIGLTGWIGIAPLNDPSYNLSAGLNSFAFNQFVLPENTTNLWTFALVIYTTNTLNSTATADILEIEDVSLVPSSYASKSNAKTADQVLRECQYYYQKSYNPLVLPGTADFSNCIVARQGIFGQASTTASIFSAEFNVNYSQKRTVAPTITLYNPAATNDTTNVVVSIQYPGIADASAAVLQTNWTQFILGSKTAGYKTNNVAALLSSSALGGNYSAAVDGIVEFQYTCDARLGRVA